jgi:hypothetical protein
MALYVPHHCTLNEAFAAKKVGLSLRFQKNAAWTLGLLREPSGYRVGGRSEKGCFH